MINIGDRLRVNDCGPILFAEEHGREGQVKCSWMDPMGQWHVRAFASADLHRVDESGGVGGTGGSRWSNMLTRVSSFAALW